MQIVSAIKIAWDPTADQSQKPAAFEFVNQLRNEAAAWHPCLNIFTRVPRHDEVVRVFCLEIVNAAVRNAILDKQGLELVKDSLLHYLRQEYTPSADPSMKHNPPDSSTIENKLAQTVTFLFISLYNVSWTTCFDDLLALTSTSSGKRDNPFGVAFYLRAINSIHDEIGDNLVSRARDEQDVANLLKDLIRQRDMHKIARSWQEILSYWQVTNGRVAELAMKSIGKYVSWIDISLVVNPEMLQLILQQLEQAHDPDLDYNKQCARDAAIDVFTEIVSKKMPAKDKIDVLSFVGLQSIVERISAWPLLRDPGTSTYDVDLAENVAKLVNAAVLDIVRVLETEDQTSETWRSAEAMLRGFLPQLLRYFSDEYDDVCLHVLPAMTDLLSFVRRAFSGEEFVSQRAALLIPVLKAIFHKSRVDAFADTDGEYDGENTEEAEFIELRKRLSSLQQQVAAADEQLYIDAVSELVNETFEQLEVQGRKLDWRSLDLALHEMYLLGNLAVKSGGLYNKNKPNSPAAERLVRMMLLMVQSSAGTYHVPTVQCQYMEICNQYSSFFDKHPQYIEPVLQNFLKLAHSTNLRVKQRSWYVLQRFVRAQRINIGPAADAVIASLSDLLSIQADLPTQEENDESEEESTDNTFNSQLYLFETIGSIISAPTVPSDKQIQFAQAVMQPLFTDIQNHIEAAQSNKRAALQIHHDIMALGTVARGCFDWSGDALHKTASNIAAPLRDAFAQVAEVTLAALEALKSSFDVRSAARFTFSRLFGMVGAHMLPQLPRWVEGLLTAASSRDEMAQFLRLLDQITFGFKNEIFALLDQLFASVLQRILAGLSMTTSGTDDEVELAELKREYINFLLVILGNGLGGVLVSSTNQAHFETLIKTIEHFTKDISDPTTAKMSFSLLSRMCLVWGGADLVPNQILVSDVNPVSTQELPGFKSFMMTRFSPLCWAVPMAPGFNAKDGQTRLVLMEAAGLQKTIYAKCGAEYLQYLKSTELPGIGLQGQMQDEFITKLSESDYKSWKSWFARFVASAVGGS